MSIAQTILAQLGGNKFLAMTGAKTLVDFGHGLHFRLPGRRINSVVVRLEPNDTYTVLFNKRTNGGLDIHKVSSAVGIYAEQLRAVFEEHTGLATSL